MPLGGLVSGGVALAGGVLGNLFASGDRSKAKQISDEAYALLANAGVPPDLSKAIIMQKFQEAGMMSPELEQHVALGPSAIAGIGEDAALREAQTGALQKLQQVSRGGLRPEDRAAYNQLRNEGAAALQGKIGQIQQGFQARGQGGQGAELAAMLGASQEGANRASQQGDQISADASRRALEALSTSGQMAGNIRAQDFDVSRTKGEAADRLAQFNAANSMAIQSRNIAAKNAAQMQNLQNKQSVMDRNTMQGNAELLRQNEARRQFYQDQMARNQAIANAKTNQANLLMGQAGNTAQNWQTIGAGASGFLNNAFADQQRAKTAQGWQDIARRALGRGQAVVGSKAGSALGSQFGGSLVDEEIPRNIYDPKKPWSP